MLQSGWTSATIIPTPALNASTKPRQLNRLEGQKLPEILGWHFGQKNSDHSDQLATIRGSEQIGEFSLVSWYQVL